MIDYLAHLRADVERVLAVLEGSALTETVAGCPGWTLRELVEHLGNVHRWATRIVQSGTVQEEPTGSPDDPRAWFAAGAAELLAALAAADPAERCWSFTTDKTKGFWARRQSLETVVHRWDAEGAAGSPGPIASQLAAEGVTEVVELMTPRQVKLGRIPSPPVAVELRATDTGNSWLLGDAAVGASVEGPAELVLLLLWHRVDPGDVRLRVEGDAAAVLRLALTP